MLNLELRTLGTEFSHRIDSSINDHDFVHSKSQHLWSLNIPKNPNCSTNFCFKPLFISLLFECVNTIN